MFRWFSKSLLRRVMGVTSVLILLLVAGLVYFAYTDLKSVAYKKTIERARALTHFSEDVRNFMGLLNEKHAFKTEDLIAEFQKDMAAGKHYDETTLYHTVPVVAAWSAADSSAKENGYRLRVPKTSPRNPKNEPRPGVEDAVVKFLEGSGTLEDITKAGAEIVYPANPEDAKKMGEIGVRHVGEEQLNKAEGGGKVAINDIRFFKGITLTQDCLSCHGDPKGEKDLLGFEKEGWKAGQVHGTFEILASLDETDHDLAGILMTGSALGAAALLGVLLGVFFIMRRYVAAPIRELVAASKRVGAGDLTVELGEHGTDEIGELTSHFKEFIANIRGIVRSVKEQGNALNRPVTECETATRGVRALAAGVEEVSASSNTLAAGAEEASANLATVASAVEETTASLRAISSEVDTMTSAAQSTANSVQEMSSALGEVSRNTASAARVATSTAAAAADTKQAMEKLDNSAQQISRVMELIKQIASQTNLLALNATIEAAAAGEAGKGFAVVASEVKELSKQTSSATEDIRMKVQEMQQTVGAAVDVITRITGMVEELDRSFTTISASVEEQTSIVSGIAHNVRDTSNGFAGVARNIREASMGAEEVSRNVQEANMATGEIARSTTELAAASEEMAKNASMSAAASDRAVGELTDVSTAIRELLERFKV